MTDTIIELKPHDLNELSEMIRDVHERSSSIIPRGGGTALTIGNRNPDEASVLDLTVLSGVTSYQPADLTVSVQAGTRVSELLGLLGEHSQELPIDVPFPETATIGGLVATGFAGPRRLGSGTLKDLILGCTYVRGDGMIAKAGGSVVKNVSGFEIPRLLHGSWGTLAVLGSINFKVTPKPKSEVTLQWPVQSIAEAVQIAHSIRPTLPSATAIDVDRVGENASLLVRLMGRPGALAAQVNDLRSTYGELTQFESDESRAFWQTRANRFAVDDNDVQIALTARPRFVGEAVQSLLGRLSFGADTSSLSISPGVGSARIRIPATANRPIDIWSQIDVSTLSGNANVIIEFAPESWKAGIDVWGDRPDGTEMMKSIKAEFDPHSVLNRGRLFI